MSKWAVKFTSSAHAVAWADGFLSHPKLPSQIGQIIRETMAHPGVQIDEDGERMTGDRLRDLAETISVCLSGVENPAGTLYRHVHGRYTGILQTAEMLADTVGIGPDQTHSSMKALASLVIEDQRRRAKGGFLSVEEMARAMRLGRTAYYTRWGPAVYQMRVNVRMWLDRAERHLDEELHERGIL